jgi:ABC-type bacteriocin/lantibiotic exporter with double-glycine peptidase domain
MFQSNKLFLSYLYKPFNFHLNTNSAQLIRNLNDSTQITVGIRYIVDLSTEIFVFIGVFIFLLFINYKLTIYSFLFFGAIGFIFHKIIQSKCSEWGEIRRYRSGLKFQDLQKGFGAIKEIKLMNKEKVFSDLFFQNVNFENTADMKNTFYLSLPRVWFEWLTMITMLLVMFYLTSIQLKSDVIVIVGLLALSAHRLVPSITRVMNSVEMLKFCYPALDPYINDAKEFEKNNYLSFENTKIVQFEKSIKLDQLSFKYPGANVNIFENLALEIKKNSFIGIYGESGVGKTTLLNIVLGLLKPEIGQIYVDSKPIYKNLRGWQKLISYIPQNVFIIDDKVVNNIAIGEEESSIDLARIDKAMKVSRIYDFINSLPKKIHENCGELGERLSGGQRQRLAIARAIYRNSEIFIFDEFTNFLDAQNETSILSDVKSMNNKTRIVVSHNFNVLKNCDTVYELKKNELTNFKLK